LEFLGMGSEEGDEALPRFEEGIPEWRRGGGNTIGGERRRGDCGISGVLRGEFLQNALKGGFGGVEGIVSAGLDPIDTFLLDGFGGYQIKFVPGELLVLKFQDSAQMSFEQSGIGAGIEESFESLLFDGFNGSNVKLADFGG
jgi:hypothetical protein